jgi:hypothetical protein
LRFSWYFVEEKWWPVNAGDTGSRARDDGFDQIGAQAGKP